MEKEKASLIAIKMVMLKHGFSTDKNSKNDDIRLGIKMSLLNKEGKYIEVYDEKYYWHILHYGFNNKYLPIGFDILYKKDVLEYDKFLKKLNP